MRSNRGMSLIEATIVLLVLLLITAALAPSLTESGVPKREVAIVETLRTINKAQAEFAKDCGNGHYAPNLGWLAKPSLRAEQKFSDFHDPLYTIGYKITVVGGRPLDSPGRSSCNGLPGDLLAPTYVVKAIPVAGEPWKYFGTNQTGKIFEAANEYQLDWMIQVQR